MLQRMLELGEDEIGKRDLSSLRSSSAPARQLPASSRRRPGRARRRHLQPLRLDRGRVATIATPEDMREAPAPSASRRWGHVVKISTRRQGGARPARPGRIFVGNAMQFEGYTGGGGKDVIDGPDVDRRRRPLRRRTAACSSTAATTR
jgi:fatty-acyl-CoA synthase